MNATSGGTGSSAQALPRPQVRRIVARSADLLAHTAALAREAARRRPNHGARYLLSTIAELQGDLDRLRRHLRASSPNDP